MLAASSLRAPCWVLPHVHYRARVAAKKVNGPASPCRCLSRAPLWTGAAAPRVAVRGHDESHGRRTPLLALRQLRPLGAGPIDAPHAQDVRGPHPASCGCCKPRFLQQCGAASGHNRPRGCAALRRRWPARATCTDVLAPRAGSRLRISCYEQARQGRSTACACTAVPSERRAHDRVRATPACAPVRLRPGPPLRRCCGQKCAGVAHVSTRSFPSWGQRRGGASAIAAPTAAAALRRAARSGGAGDR